MNRVNPGQPVKLVTRVMRSKQLHRKQIKKNYKAQLKKYSIKKGSKKIIRINSG
jgi:hypothetical protein